MKKSKAKIITTQLRIPENIYEEVRLESEELGVSINAHLIELIWIGLKARKNFLISQTVEAQLNHE